jgi:hypothetical protein
MILSPKKRVSIIVMALAAQAWLSPAAKAIPTLMISDGVNAITIVDDAPADFSGPFPGLIVYAGTLGTWNINASMGFTKPLSGSSALPQMTLNFFVTSPGSGTLTIGFSENGFGPSNAVTEAGYSATVNSLGGSSVRYDTLVSSSNTEFAGTMLFTSQIFASGAGSAAAQAALNLPASYALTQIVQIIHSGAGNSSGNYELTATAVPESGQSLYLLGVAVAGLELLRRGLCKG